MRSIREITCLLEFNRKEERSRNIDSLHFNALHIGPAEIDLILPEQIAGRIRLSIQEIDVMLTHKGAGDVDWIY